ncbi:TonB-dependent receptor [Mucilaginibacter arboris]|uniref:Outer membrane beta-barrel protein n=1 Tax=Mucilaginibacter arboris TaxID=2682090 RepID=A0A7K1SY72_9SPHI|nr:TonB-dependent receptor [Mucilaginibacter arboris]MVN22269.1 outer membrane beta-barrel protein [Mucilaginibacter arboris]
MKKLLLLILLFSVSLKLTAAGNSIVKGVVTDKQTGEPMLGAVVTLKNIKTSGKISTATGLDGSFIFKNVEQGNYELEGKFISYQDSETIFSVAAGEVKTVNISLQTKSNGLKEVTIAGKVDAGSDQASRRIEQRSDQVLNAVSARTIEVSPDITVANVMQRVSGVSVERSNNGEAQYPIIRGMEKRYISTLVNGIKIPSPDNKNRYVPLDIFPADIVDRLEIYKSLTPNMEGDAIAGVVNMVLKTAPDVFTVQANLGTGYAQSVSANGFTKFDQSISSSRSSRINNGANYIATMADFPNNPQHFSNSKAPLGTIFNLSLGGRTKNKKFGAIGAVSYQNQYRNTSSIFFDTEVDPATNDPSVQSIEKRSYSTQQERTAIITKFDYRFDHSNSISLNASYINLTQNQYRFTSDTSLTLGRTAIGNGRVTQDPRSVKTVQQIYNFNLQGDHHVAKHFSINWSAVYSKATANENRSELALITGRTPQPDGSVLQQPVSIDALKGQTRIFGYNTDEDKSGYLNFIFKPEIFDVHVEFSAGGMYRNKTRNSTYDNYTLALPVSNSTQNYNGNIDDNTFVVSTIQGTQSDALNYNFTENVGAAYGQFKFTIGKLQTLGGVRYEYTNQDWVSALPNTQTGKTGSIKYYDFLPSLNFKYMLNDQQNLRLSYYSAISRPGFYELIPHTGGDPDADYKEVGNPYLKRVTAENFDLRYEFFPKALDQLLAGVFYKKINNPIEYTLEKSGLDYVLKADNFGTGYNYGFELDVTKYIHNFGFRANYTYTESKITTTKLEDYRNGEGFLTARTVLQSRPLQGQSKILGNFSFLYKQPNTGFDAQLSLVYTGARINTVSTYYENDVWQKGFVTLDFSTEKRLFKKIYGYAKINNLLNTPYQLEIRRPYPMSGQVVELQTAGQNTFVRKDSYQQYYLIGLRYKL